MPGTTRPFAPRYTAPPTTKEDLKWADLPIIDLSKADTPAGRAELAIQVRDAMHTVGFFYVVNHGYTQAQNDRVFDIADVPFSQVVDEEKLRYSCQFDDTGSYKGYKLRQLWSIENGIKDQIEQYDFFEQERHPPELQPFLPEVRSFAEHNHYNVLFPLLKLLALGLELPEETFTNMHDLQDERQAHVRFMKYFPRSADEETKTKNVWLKGHTDLGSVTILWSQPISALQVMSLDGKWRWVRHIDNALVINIGDVMEMLSGGYYKATIHRVVQPPADQRGYARLGAFYFAQTKDDVKLAPLIQSPVLQREGVWRRIDDEHAPTMVQWRSGIIKAYGVTELTRKTEVIEEEIIHGVVVKHYS